MMKLKKLKPELRFQVRNRETDLKLLVKEYFKDDYSNYLEFKLDIVDGDTLPKLKTIAKPDPADNYIKRTAKAVNTERETLLQDDGFSTKHKRGRRSPKKKRTPNSAIDVITFIENMINLKRPNQSFTIEEEESDTESEKDTSMVSPASKQTKTLNDANSTTNDVAEVTANQINE